MGAVLKIVPSSLDDAATQIDHCHSSLFNTAGAIGSLEHPEGISGKTTGAIHHAQSRMRNLVSSLPEESYMLRATAILALHYGAGAAAGIALKMPLSSPFLPPAKHPKKKHWYEEALDVPGGMAKELVAQGKNLGNLGVLALAMSPAGMLNPRLREVRGNFQKALLAMATHPKAFAKALYDTNIGDVGKEWKTNKGSAIGIAIVRLAELASLGGETATAASSMARVEKMLSPAQLAAVRKVAAAASKAGDLGDIRKISGKYLDGAASRAQTANRGLSDLHIKNLERKGSELLDHDGRIPKTLEGEADKVLQKIVDTKHVQATVDKQLQHARDLAEKIDKAPTIGTDYTDQAVRGIEQGHKNLEHQEEQKQEREHAHR